MTDRAHCIVHQYTLYLRHIHMSTSRGAERLPLPKRGRELTMMGCP
jgi:hypothetical protein